MGTIVSKFGGSSICDASMFRQVRRIVESKPGCPYIILSAPGRRSTEDMKITDLLCRAYEEHSYGRDTGSFLRAVRQRFTSIILELNLDVDPDSFLSGLDSDVRRSRDHAASRGEYLCAKLFSIYTGIPFVDATTLIRFDSNGKILRGEINRCVQGMAKRFPYAVIPGFYGSMPDGEIKTFSRGGSDITGALVAAALSASAYENWTDVDGLMSVDPSVCNGAVCHPAVSYRQMRKLAQAGAQVLHPYCLEPVWESHVPTALKNTFAPEKPGTYISDHVRTTVPCVCAKDGYRAIVLDLLNTQARAVAEELSQELFRTVNGQTCLLLQTDLPGSVPVCIISIFGLPARMSEQAERLVHPIAVLNSDGCMKFLVEPSRKQSAACALHGLLMQSFRAARTP